MYQDLSFMKVPLPEDVLKLKIKMNNSIIGFTLNLKGV